MRRMDTDLGKASTLPDGFSTCLGSLRYRPSHANLRWTTERVDRFSKVLTVSEYATTAVAGPDMAFF
jgi:hypothetical protein